MAVSPLTISNALLHPLMSADRLDEPWVLRAAERLVKTLEQTADIDIECGALYHAAHGLLLYRNRLRLMP